jgi:hypothetical protein
MMPTLVDEPPEGDGWIHEIKHDGYRTILAVDSAATRAFIGKADLSQIAFSREVPAPPGGVRRSPLPWASRVGHEEGDVSATFIPRRVVVDSRQRRANRKSVVVRIGPPTPALSRTWIARFRPSFLIVR